MELLSILAPYIVALITLLGVLITAYKTKALRLFEIYFEKKNNAYIDLIHYIYSYPKSCSFNELSDAFHQTLLFISKEARKEALPLIADILYQLSDNSAHDKISNLTIELCEVLRKDLEACRKNKLH